MLRSKFSAAALFILLLVIFILNSQLSNQWANPDLTLTGRQIQCFAISNSALLSGTDGVLVRSTDNGTSWTNIGEFLFAGTRQGSVGGVYISSDNGNNWTLSLDDPDVLGNEVATLVNEEKPAGVYEVTFDASKLTSGVYFYKISAGSFVETKKMVLLR